MGGPCDYEPYDVECRPIDSGRDARRGIVWARYRAALEGWPELDARIEVEAPASGAGDVLARLQASRRCRGTQERYGSCNPYTPMDIDVPPLPDGARVVFRGAEK